MEGEVDYNAGVYMDSDQVSYLYTDLLDKEDREVESGVVGEAVA
jgi:hypothetical protein